MQQKNASLFQKNTNTKKIRKKYLTRVFQMKLKNKRINYNGKHYNSLSQLARDYNISIPTIQTRWQKGIRNPEELIAIPNLNDLPPIK